MARVMQKVTPVRIATDEVNCYATIMRSMISATTAALRLGDHELANKFKALKNNASESYDKAIAKHEMEIPNNPSLG